MEALHPTEAPIKVFNPIRIEIYRKRTPKTSIREITAKYRNLPPYWI
jgi:hypothetical protein